MITDDRRVAHHWLQRRTDRAENDKINVVCFEIFQRESTSLRCSIINMTFDYAERTFVRGNLRGKTILHKTILPAMVLLLKTAGDVPVA